MDGSSIELATEAWSPAELFGMNLLEFGWYVLRFISAFLSISMAVSHDSKQLFSSLDVYK